MMKKLHVPPNPFHFPPVVGTIHTTFFGPVGSMQNNNIVDEPIAIGIVERPVALQAGIQLIQQGPERVLKLGHSSGLAIAVMQFGVVGHLPILHVKKGVVLAIGVFLNPFLDAQVPEYLVFVLGGQGSIGMIRELHEKERDDKGAHGGIEGFLGTNARLQVATTLTVMFFLGGVEFFQQDFQLLQLFFQSGGRSAGKGTSEGIPRARKTLLDDDDEHGSRPVVSGRVLWFPLSFGVVVVGRVVFGWTGGFGHELAWIHQRLGTLLQLGSGTFLRSKPWACSCR